MIITLGLTGTTFGAMHFLTWSSSMPTLTELWMWRSASIALTALPTLSMLFLMVFPRLVYSSNKTPLWVFVGRLLVLFAFGFAFVHPIIRFVIAIDSIVLLRDIPDTAFLVLSWSDAIPSL